MDQENMYLMGMNYLPGDKSFSAEIGIKENGSFDGPVLIADCPKSKIFGKISRLSKRVDLRFAISDSFEDINLVYMLSKPKRNGFSGEYAGSVGIYEPMDFDPKSGLFLPYFELIHPINNSEVVIL